MAAELSPAQGIPLSISSKMWISYKKTFSNRNNTLVVGSLAIGATLSSSFRFGLFTSPVGMASSFLITRSNLGERFFSGLPERFITLATRVNRVLDRILSLIIQDSAITDCLTIPVIEEFIFRGAIQSVSVAALGSVTGVALSAFAFSTVHCDRTQPHQILNGLVGGVALGALKEKVSLSASLGFHMGTNAFWCIVLGYLGPEKGLVRNYLELR